MIRALGAVAIAFAFAACSEPPNDCHGGAHIDRSCVLLCGSTNFPCYADGAVADVDVFGLDVPHLDAANDDSQACSAPLMG